MGWKSGYVQVGEVRLHYWRRGTGAPLVLAHGFGDSGECWTRVAEALEDEYDIVAYDARYHGLSDAPDTAEMQRSAMGDDLVGVCEALALERPAIMGHSMGGMTVMFAAAAYPELFSCAVMEDPPFWSEEPPQRQPSALPGTVEAVEEMGRKFNPGWHESEFGPWARAKLQLRMQMQGRRGLPGIDAWRTEVAKMDLPTLLVCGGNRERMAIVTDEVAAEMRRTNPQLEVVKFAGAGHNVRREALEGFVAATRTFLGKHAGAALTNGAT
jgi:pimeloyl-ACP methyl ester carboxylesterase